MRFSLHDGPGIRTTVFLKGCPLACWWCHNPEGQEFGFSPMYFESRCRRCGDCVEACPHGAITLEDGVIRASGRCQRCGMCVSACGTGARQMAGRRIGVAEALQEIERDVLFFEESGGGVTISGGEPLSQPAFAEALLAACRAHRIHTALDTSGFAPRDVALRVSAHADLVLYDLKLLDSAAHEKYTGVPNGPILANLEALVEAGRNVVVRVPLIPGLNDTPEALGGLASLASRLGLRRIDLLPYHRIGSHKYSHLSMESRLGEVQPPPPGELSRFAGELGSRGFQVRIGG
jgi:pyruvate formate lyase activating enzyme